MDFDTLDSGKSVCLSNSSEKSYISDECGVYASFSSLNNLDLSDIDLPCSKVFATNVEAKNKCINVFDFALPTCQKTTKNVVWSTFTENNDSDAFNEIKENVNYINKDSNKMIQGIKYDLEEDLDISALNCPGLTSDEDDNESDISDFTEDLDDEDSDLDSDFQINSKAPSVRKYLFEKQVKDTNTMDKANSNCKSNNIISTNLYDIGIDYNYERKMSSGTLKKMDLPNKSFNEPIVFNDIPFTSLYKYYKQDEHIKSLFLDRMALMLYTLSYVVKGTGELVSARFEGFFCNYYKITAQEFKQWTGFNFPDFLRSRYCSPYFRIIYDEVKQKYFVRFNESDKEFTRLGNEMVGVRKVNDETMRRKLVGIERKLNDIEDKEECLEEKLRWLTLLTYAPKDQAEISVSSFQLNFDHYYKNKLDSKYLSSIFMRASISGVVKHVFANELEFINENGGAIKIICDLNEAIIEIKKKLEFMRSEEYKRAVNLKKTRLSGDLPPIQRRVSKAPRVWNFDQEIVKNIMGDENQVPLHEKYSKLPSSGNVNQKAKPVYTSTNVIQSDDEEDSGDDF
uniref:HSF-type DNA-binding domain-containing protein n=1 Tax=Strongyloides stercoralis TaxID=6248 RepID=A0AAF5DJ47_STRER